MMTWKETLETPITIYWWNMGKKTLDFKGPVDEYLKKRDITMTALRKRSGKYGVMGRHFEFDCGGHVTLDTQTELEVNQ